MDPVQILLISAVVAACGAILIYFTQRSPSDEQKNECGMHGETNELGRVSAAGPGAFAAPAKPKGSGQTNNRGWRAPERYYFNENGDLFDTLSGDMFTDMMVIAGICGEEYDGGVLEEVTEEAVFDSPVADDPPIVGSGVVAEAVGSETIASRPIDVETAAPASSYDGSEYAGSDYSSDDGPAPYGDD